MVITTPMFDAEITDIFGEHIKDGRIMCSEKEFRVCFKKLAKQLNLNKSDSKKSTGRKKSSFMTWKTQNYESIKDEYFADFEGHTDWSESGIRKYYLSKSLPIEKLNVLIEKKSSEGKTITKPRLMALITIKAGIIWSEMNDDEKSKYENLSESESESESEPKTKSSYNKGSINPCKKKGRPSGYKPTNFVIDKAVESALENKNINNEISDDEVELEQIIIKNKTYLKDDDNNIYNEELELIGLIDKCGNITYNK